MVPTYLYCLGRSLVGEHTAWVIHSKHYIMYCNSVLTSERRKRRRRNRVKIVYLFCFLIFRCRERQKKENGESLAENRKLDVANKLFREENDCLQTLPQLISEDGYLHNQFPSVRFITPKMRTFYPRKCLRHYYLMLLAIASGLSYLESTSLLVNRFGIHPECIDFLYGCICLNLLKFFLERTPAQY